MDTLTNPWCTFFNVPQHSDGHHGSPDGPSPPDLDQQTSQKLLREESTSSDSFPFPQTQDANLSPAAMFLAAFTPPIQSTRMPDDEGEMVAGYTLGPVIGLGGFSAIRRAFSPSGGVVAIKIVRRSDVQRQSNPSLTRKRLDHETEIWSSLSHEHILPLFSTEHRSYADFYVMLFCPAGSLFDILKRDGSPALPHDDAGMMFRQVVRGVRYLHEIAGYVHRDIKLENVLVDEMGVCRICDFGLTRKIGESDYEQRVDDSDGPPIHRHRSAIHHTVRRSKALLPAHASILRHGPRRHRTSTPIGDHSPAPVHPAHAFQPGSLPYTAPELLSPQTHGGHHGANPAQDMWALGCLLYALLTGRLPFSDPFEPRLTMKILHGVYDMPSNIGRGAARVLRGCLEHDVQYRWNIAMVDDIAWDIGLGEADESSVSHADDYEFVHCHTQHPSSRRRRSQSRSPDFPSLGGPSCRPRRSLSRTSATTSSSLSTRSTSRSVSRSRATYLPLAAACDDVERAPTSLDIRGSAPMSPASLIERGRSPKKAGLRQSARFAPSIGTSITRSDRGCEPSGREMYSATDVLDSTARWASALGLNAIAEVTTHLNGASSPAIQELRRIQHAQRCGGSKGSKRAESTPPVSSVWPARRSRAGVKDDSSLLSLGESCTGRAFLREPSATPIPIVRKTGTRSRSEGYEPNNTARRPF
ncbi:kinase-like domain-containing protein [Boletus reticuloceps]|uniref:Kinase-like domain-containing protein n=1 Tax=Boletus reticuloceps TaxID=495285 RepID=A0A8I3ADC2_9AGAM|nr:kinase-like domain-containing protein [Boletus reticuloceps]